MAEHEYEIYDKVYAAIPISESPLFTWVQGINGHKDFYHVSLFFFGRLDSGSLEEVKATILSVPLKAEDIFLIPQKLDFYHSRKDETFVLKLEESEKITELRKAFETNFPKERKFNDSYIPHITIETAHLGTFNDHQRRMYQKIKDISSTLPAYQAKTIGVYYRIDGATALLFAKKL